MATIYEKLDRASGGRMRGGFNKTVNAAVKHYQQKYGFEMGEGEHASWNNEADAFKHAYMQWMLGYLGGNDSAKELGDMHENETPNAPLGERNMDLWNNVIGREVAEEMKKSKWYGLYDGDTGMAWDIAAEKIMQRMRDGEMITRPDDPRKFENMEKERLKESDRVYYKGEFDNSEIPVVDRITDRYLEQSIENGGKFPTKQELDVQVGSGDLIYVDDYTKADGTEVKGYYRKRTMH